MPQYAVSAIGRDRPGIVAAVTRVLLDHDVNVEDSQMTILRGRFTMTLLLAAPEDVDEAGLRGELDAAGRGLELDAISLEPVGEAAEAQSSEPSHIVTVYGVDHPGIVSAVTAALAAARVNITDLETRLVSDAEGEDLYAMMLEVALPPGAGADDLEGALESTRTDQGVEVSIRELERDEL
ncbi:MAG: glycine cleavage system transcriptional repressor [Solirubrobacteraceae bacterium]|jgi:glycine cleavage system transcriptional repressor|nr:glycine cleavage system transcriptional repressor [Solirubrobacteraceae bacterium]